MDFLSSDGALFTTDLTRLVDPLLDFWRDFQLRSYLCSSGITVRTLLLTALEDLCHKGDPVRTVSLQSIHFLSVEKQFTPNGMSELGVSFMVPQMEKILHFAQKSSMATRVQEINYKLLTRWYQVPTKLNHILPQLSDVCWLCGVNSGTSSHFLAMPEAPIVLMRSNWH